MLNFPDFFADLFLASMMIAMTAIIHAVVQDRLFEAMSAYIPRARTKRPSRHVWQTGLAVFCVLGLFLSHTIHIWMWAALYLWLDIPTLQTLEDAVYFSAVTYTTVGYGDLVVTGPWRVLSSIEAANGFIMIGWSTAFLFEIISHLYPRVPRV